jgi:Gram-negative porin
MLDADADGVQLGWLSVDYQFTNDLLGKAGQSKEPWGWYNETFDARFLQLSAVLPFMYHDAAGFRDEVYRGLGLSYAHDIGGAGRLAVDGYLGEPVILGDEAKSSDEKLRGLFGGTVTYDTPLAGLRFRLSAFTHKNENTTTGEKIRENSNALSAEYVANNWDLKAEYARVKEDTKKESYYIQAGYTFADKWTPYGRYDYIATDTAQKSDSSFYQKAFVVGLDYKINGNLSVRGENHFNKGYGLPVASGEVVLNTGDRKHEQYGTPNI